MWANLCSNHEVHVVFDMRCLAFKTLKKAPDSFAWCYILFAKNLFCTWQNFLKSKCWCHFVWREPMQEKRIFENFTVSLRFLGAPCLVGRMIDLCLSGWGFESHRSTFVNGSTIVTWHDLYPLPCFSIDMQLRAFWRTFAFYDERRFVKGRVLLTGATGFLGVFLLRELLLQTRVSFCSRWNH